MDITNLSPRQLRQAADLKEKIDGLQDQLNEILGGEVSTPDAPEPAAESGRKKRKMTAAWRKALSLAQKARWAAKRGEAPSKTAPAKVDQGKAQEVYFPCFEEGQVRSDEGKVGKGEKGGQVEAVEFRFQ